MNYPEFAFESEAKGDSLIGVHQAKTFKNWKDAYSLNLCVVLGIKVTPWLLLMDENVDLQNTQLLPASLQVVTHLS